MCVHLKFPEICSKFHSNRKNVYIHLGLDKSLFSFENNKTFLQEVTNFLSQHIKSGLLCVFPPNLVYIMLYGERKYNG